MARRRPIKWHVNGSPYRFRLERVRALRERHEEQAKQELATAMARRHQCEQRVDDAAQRIEIAREAQTQVGSFSPEDLLARQAYLERVEHLHESGLESLRRHEDDVAGRREALTEAAQARQVLERLKAKGLAQHQREQARLETVALDEIAINGHRRRAA